MEIYCINSNNFLKVIPNSSSLVVSEIVILRVYYLLNKTNLSTCLLPERSEKVESYMVKLNGNSTFDSGKGPDNVS